LAPAGTAIGAEDLPSGRWASDGVPVMHHLIVKIDRDIDEVLVNLGNMVLKLSSPALTRTAEQHQALARSVNQFSLCANRSTDPRVQKLAEQLEGTLRPRLRLVASR
jgi:hypothetical protein